MPPAFAKSKKDLHPAVRAYRKLARLAAAVVAPGGILFVASCSHNVPVDQFAAAVAAGIHDARRTGRILRQSGAGPDHPVHPHLPETAYLKALTLQLDYRERPPVDIRHDAGQWCGPVKRAQ
jgi:23S rRNA (cytosine1962-C5)-methyltransferase